MDIFSEFESGTLDIKQLYRIIVPHVLDNSTKGGGQGGLTESLNVLTGFLGNGIKQVNTTEQLTMSTT